MAAGGRGGGAQPRAGPGGAAGGAAARDSGAGGGAAAIAAARRGGAARRPGAEAGSAASEPGASPAAAGPEGGATAAAASGTVRRDPAAPPGRGREGQRGGGGGRGGRWWSGPCAGRRGTGRGGRHLARCGDRRRGETARRNAALGPGGCRRRRRHGGGERARHAGAGPRAAGYGHPGGFRHGAADQAENLGSGPAIGLAQAGHGLLRGRWAGPCRKTAIVEPGRAEGGQRLRHVALGIPTHRQHHLGNSRFPAIMRGDFPSRLYGITR